MPCVADDLSVQILLGEKLRYQVCNLDVVQVGHREVRIALDADFRKVNQRDVAPRAG